MTTITPADCARLDEWARQMFTPSLPPISVVSDESRPLGQPMRDLGRRLLRLHPADHEALRAWVIEREG